MAIYSWLLALALVVGAPYWMARMLGSGRYRAGLRERLGRVPEGLKAAIAGRQVVWLHAVSVGEVMAAVRLVGELRAALTEALGGEWVVAVSTTTETGQRLARQRLGEDVPVFYMPLDFKWVLRRYLGVLRPRLVVLMESELWPRLMWECGRAGIPLAVVNARVSDRSFPTYMRLRGLWQPLLRRVGLFLAQDEETAGRLRAIGVKQERVRVTGNLKYDVRVVGTRRMAEWIRELAAGRRVLVAGSTLGATERTGLGEEEMVIQAWEGDLRRKMDVMMVVAPRHPERFGEVESVVCEFRYVKASGVAWMKEGNPPFAEGAKDGPPGFVEGARGFEVGAPGLVDGEQSGGGSVEVVLLDTIGDLAAVYGVAGVAFVGGSLVKKGGHNPLEAAQFGVPVVMGESYENFRGIVGAMREADAIRIVGRDGLGDALVELMRDRSEAEAMGERGRAVFEAQAGATGRTVEALVELVRERAVKLER